MQRIRVVIYGAVQGVGFRPFVYRLATGLNLTGWVNNTAQGVVMEVEGKLKNLEEFLYLLETDLPPLASIHSIETVYLDPAGYSGFKIEESSGGKVTALVMPDIATCKNCLEDIRNPENRRYRYPFTNCTNCGPRYSIIKSLPYDRINTTMRIFEMCEECRAEYENPADRRFHAQPNACPVCGPHMELRNSSGKTVFERDEALRETSALLQRGKIVAVKGLGGFHLMAAAGNDEAVSRLRRRKGREEKPFAVMVPSLKAAEYFCRISEKEARLLQSPESPIVLLDKSSGNHNSREYISENIAPGNPALGLMLPYTPLHHLLMAEYDGPLIATSGNRSDEPICIEKNEAISRLAGIADYFLVHNRPIARHVDDSIVRILLGREQVLRRARGYSPLPVGLRKPRKTILATGAHLKNSVSISVGDSVFISQHIGDLDNALARQTYRRVTGDFQELYDVKPEFIVCDKHPDYYSTRFAEELCVEVIRVQHHYAHALSCMAENEISPPALAVVWDGTGYGTDSTIWGGEFLLINETSFERVVYLKKFRLPGGEKAVEEPARTAIGLLYELFGNQLANKRKLSPVALFSEKQLEIITGALEKKINSPQTSSIGRLFDGVASILGLCHRNRFEGQAAMMLEWAAGDLESEDSYEFPVLDNSSGKEKTQLLVDWQPALLSILSDLEKNRSIDEISLRFHNGLVNAILAIARKIGQETVLLSGGCFQNRYLTCHAVEKLTENGFKPYWHQRVPPNDGGISLGQISAAERFLKRPEKT